MLVAGDECRRTQGGNNNAYCQDNETSWFDWGLVEAHPELLRFVRTMIHFRRSQPTVRRRWYMTGKKIEDRMIADVTWFTPEARTIDWHNGELAMSCLLAAPHSREDPTGEGKDLFLLMNPGHEAVQFLVPQSVARKRWFRFVDTAADSPRDIFPAADGPELDKGQFELLPRSMMIYVSG